MRTRSSKKSKSLMILHFALVWNTSIQACHANMNSMWESRSIKGYSLVRDGSRATKIFA